MRRPLALAAILTFAWTCGATFAAARTSDARLADAAMKGDTDALRSLLREKVDVNAPGADGTPALHWAVRADDVDAVGLLIHAGADVRAPNRYGVTPIHIAAANGNAAMLRLLIDAGADPNTVDPTGETTLVTAVRSADLDSVRLLIDRGAAVDAKDAEYQQTALMWAVRESTPAIVRLLIDRGADIRARTRQGATPEFRPPNPPGGGSHGVGIVRSGLPPEGSRAPIPGAMTPLLYAARDGKLEAAAMLIAAGADVNVTEANGTTPLLMAITNNHIPLARVLIEKGADIQSVDWYGRTPLWAAVEVRNMDVDSSTYENGVDRASALELIQTLLDRGAAPNPRVAHYPPTRRFMMPLGSLSWVDFTGETPFLMASLAGDVTLMRLLLKHGADPNITTLGGTTPLMAAAGVNWVVHQTYTESKENLLEAVKLCLELGNDINAVNEMGLTAVHGAANRGSDDILQFLVEHGAKLDVKDKEGRSALNWAEGVFLATNAPEPKPSTIALIQKLIFTAKAQRSRE